jgi:hypothetical protein
MGRIIVHRILFGVVVILMLSLTSLNACDEKTPQPIPYFPVQSEVQKIGLGALLSGELVIDDNGCLRVFNYLILWPYGYTFEMEGNDIWVVNEEEVRVAKVGDKVRMGGGEIPPDFAEEKIGQALPEDCAGSYWLVAFSIEKEE